MTQLQGTCGALLTSVNADTASREELWTAGSREVSSELCSVNYSLSSTPIQVSLPIGQSFHSFQLMHYWRLGSKTASTERDLHVTVGRTRPTSPPPVVVTPGAARCPWCGSVGGTGTGVFGDGDAAAHPRTRQEGLLQE